MKKPPPFTIVQSGVSHDVIEALEFLLGEAKRGELIGLAYAGMMKRRICIADTAGEAHANPLFAQGIVFSLLADISDQARHKK